MQVSVPCLVMQRTEGCFRTEVTFLFEQRYLEFIKKAKLASLPFNGTAQISPYTSDHHTSEPNTTGLCQVELHTLKMRVASCKNGYTTKGVRLFVKKAVERSSERGGREESLEKYQNLHIKCLIPLISAVIGDSEAKEGPSR